VGNAAGVFQVGGAHVFSTARGYGQACKLGLGSIAEAAVWPLLVVLRFPVRYLPACVEQVGEPAHLQALLAQPAMEALHVCVLR
jgi:hypothetical protein